MGISCNVYSLLYALHIQSVAKHWGRRKDMPMTQVTVATIKLFGGHSALDFTNTVNSRGAHFGPDVLQTFGDLLNWGERLGVIDRPELDALSRLPPRQGEASLARAKTLREALYRIFAAPDACDSADLDLLQRYAHAAQTARVLVPAANGYAWRWRLGDPDTVIHRVALAAADLLTSPALGRVHVCPGENCAWLFLDTSRSGRRLWCSDETCGTRDRVRRWRSRQRDQG
jgi:predicted RNA-binding Zn ribbon-like protein